MTAAPRKPSVGDKQDKGSDVQAMFADIAPRYDLLNRVLSLGVDRGWRREAAREALAFAPARVLDVATGTADFALELKTRAPQAEVVGSDSMDPTTPSLILAQATDSRTRPPASPSDIHRFTCRLLLAGTSPSSSVGTAQRSPFALLTSTEMTNATSRHSATAAGNSAIIRKVMPYCACRGLSRL